jgi:predicted CoA-binding protein
MGVIEMNTVDLRNLVKSSRTILLIDWPHVQLPHTLLKQGFEVYGRSPSGYSKAEFLTEASPDGKSLAIGEKEGFIRFNRLENGPDRVDIIHIFRPAEELKHLIGKAVIPLKPKVLWLQPPIASDEARRLADEGGIGFVQGVDIIDVINSLT